MGIWRGWLVGLSVMAIGWWGGLAWAGDAGQALPAADRLACAFLKGVTALFTPQGRVVMKPPLDPNSPGLTIDIVDRAKFRAVLEEDDKETPGAFLLSPMGLTVMARDGAGNVTVVTVYAEYSGVSDNFPMVSSLHGGGLEPRISQRYGLCRVVPARAASPAPGPSAVPKAPQAHQ
jgi:hypothetical protein